MPAVSQQQQKFMGIVRAIQKGDAKPGDFSKKARDAAKKMKKKDVKKFAATKHDDLPKKVKKKESVFAIKGKDIGKGYKIATEPDFIYDPEKKMKKESINEDGHTDVASVERKLKLIGQYTIDLIRQLQNMSNEDSLPSWWTDKITLAKNYIEKSRNYLVVPVEGFASDAQRRAAFASGYKEKGKKKKKNEDITSSGYSQLKKIAYGISVGLKDLSKGIRSQNDDMVLPEIEYIYDKAIEMKKMLKNKRFNESVNEAERKMSSLEMQQIILLAKAMREMPGSPAQKKIKKQINVIRKKLGQASVKESINENFYVLYSPKNKVSTPTARIYGKEKDAIKFAKEKSKTHMTMILTKKEIRKIGAFNLENVNETPQMAKQGQVGILIKLANKQLQNVFSLHKRGKNKEAKVVLNNKVYSTMEYISRAFKTLGESVNEVSGVDVAKKVLKNKQHEKGIDLQTANLIVTIDKAYDKNPRLQKKFRALQLPKMKQLILKYYG